MNFQNSTKKPTKFLALAVLSLFSLCHGQPHTYENNASSDNDNNNDYDLGKYFYQTYSAPQITDIKGRNFAEKLFFNSHLANQFAMHNELMAPSIGSFGGPRLTSSSQNGRLDQTLTNLKKSEVLKRLQKKRGMSKQNRNKRQTAFSSKASEYSDFDEMMKNYRYRNLNKKLLSKKMQGKKRRSNNKRGSSPSRSQKFYGSEETNRALAEILFGNVRPNCKNCRKI